MTSLCVIELVSIYYDVIIVKLHQETLLYYDFFEKGIKTLDNVKNIVCYFNLLHDLFDQTTLVILLKL